MNHKNDPPNETLRLGDSRRSFASSTGDTEQVTRLNRRTFLKMGASAAVALSIPGMISCMPAPLVQPIPSAGSVALPPTASTNKLYETTLTVQRAMVDALQPGGGVQTSGPVRTYNGRVPGPTVRFKRGSDGGQLWIKLLNQLDPIAPGSSDTNCPTSMNTEHGFNTTNIHVHGLHVSPVQDASLQYDADNVFLAVLPKGETPPAGCGHHTEWRQGEVQYVYDILPNHPPGTHWYHAHKHGSAARQVGNGLFGALIVDEEEGELPHYIASTRAREQILFVHSISDEMHGMGGQLALRNEAGAVQPTIQMRPGEVQRWRLINASPSEKHFVAPKIQDLLGVRLDQIELYLIAFDGIMLPKRLDVKKALLLPEDPPYNWAALAPGNRADFLVRALPSARGKFTVKARAFNHSPTQNHLETDMVRVVIEGGQVDDPWDDNDALPAPSLPDLTVPSVQLARSREITLGRPNRINGKLYDGNLLSPPMKLNTVEEWTIVNETGEMHPFHIHVNPFFVTHINGQRLAVDDERRRWQDTIAVPKNETVTFRILFADFTGKFVMHCHNLMHEDKGMMQAVKVEI